MKREQVREIRPASVDGVRFAGVPRVGLEAVAERACVRVDPSAGTLTWISDVKSWGTTVMRLPDRSQPADLPEVRGLQIVTLPVGSLVTRFLIFTDDAGNTLAISNKIDRRAFDALWPPGIFDQLTGYGIDVQLRTFKNFRQLGRRFPGSDRFGYLLRFPFSIVVYLAPLIFAIGIYFLLRSCGAVH